MENQFVALIRRRNNVHQQNGPALRQPSHSNRISTALSQINGGVLVTGWNFKYDETACRGSEWPLRVFFHFTVR